MRILNRSVNTNTLIALAATFASICAVLIAGYQTYLSRQQQFKSAWPYLLTYENLDDKGASSIMVANYGIGPAIIDSVQVVYQDKVFSTPTEVVRQISKREKKGEYGISWSYTGIRKGFVIPPGHTIVWITVINPEDYAVFRKELARVKTVIYYHSIYEEYWKSNFHTDTQEDLVVKIE
jgi:hypothetical protein